MAAATLRTLGGSVVVAIPKSILEQAHLSPGALVDIEYRDGHLIVAPRARPKYTLAELLAKCDASSLSPTADEAEWLNGGPVGKEDSASP